jgi:nucleotide-binding universal stress UspA family protein
MSTPPSDAQPSDANAAADPVWGARTILVPVDFTPASLEAVRQGARMARASQGSVCLVHVIDSGLLNVVPESIRHQANEDVVREAEQQLADLANAELGDLPHRQHVTEGNAGEQILATAKKEGSDLIVMALHDHPEIERVFRQDTVRRVESEASCPVLTLHCDASGEIEPKLWKGTAHSRVGEWVSRVFLRAFGTPSD